MDTEYPQPAKFVNDMLAIFSLQVTSFAPPECVDPNANFYTKLDHDVRSARCATAHLGLLPLCQGRPGRQVQNVCGLDHVLRVPPQLGDGAYLPYIRVPEFDDGHHYLKAQLNLRCHGLTHLLRVVASVMIFVYPIGVPLLMFVVLYINRLEISAS